MQNCHRSLETSQLALPSLLDQLASWRASAGGAEDLSVLGESDLVDLVGEAERAKAALAALQVRATAVLHERARRTATNRAERAEVARSVGGMVALARRESPHAGNTHLGLARALTHEMPHTLAALSTGQISEFKALVLVKETAVLDTEDRTEVDARLADRMGALGVARLGREARAIGYELDRTSPLRRVRGAESDRRVSIRPAPGPMTWVGAHLPVPAGVAVFAALKQAAASLRAAGDPRTEAQAMADTLFSRVTGAETVEQVGVEVGVVMGQAALHDGSDQPAWVSGYGPVPATLARRLVRAADRAWVRRLYTDPATGQLAAADSRRRTYTGTLRRMSILRDETCRTPWCDAPVKHVDHITDHADGGPTADTNGEGLCRACNQRLNAPGWTTTGTTSHVRLHTPTGHTYDSRPPPLPGATTRVIHLVTSRADVRLDGLGASA